MNPQLVWLLFFLLCAFCFGMLAIAAAWYAEAQDDRQQRKAAREQLQRPIADMLEYSDLDGYDAIAPTRNRQPVE